MHARIFVMTSLYMLERTERDQAAVGAFENL